jgi:hypothetical protein
MCSIFNTFNIFSFILKTFPTKRGLALHVRRRHDAKYVFSSFLNSIMGLNVKFHQERIQEAYKGDQSPSQCQSGKARYVSLFKNICAYTLKCLKQYSRLLIAKIVIFRRRDCWKILKLYSCIDMKLVNLSVSVHSKHPYYDKPYYLLIFVFNLSRMLQSIKPIFKPRILAL